MDALTCVAIGATCLTTIVCSSLAFARRVVEAEDEGDADDPALPNHSANMRRSEGPYREAWQDDRPRNLGPSGALGGSGESAWVVIDTKRPP